MIRTFVGFQVSSIGVQLGKTLRITDTGQKQARQTHLFIAVFDYFLYMAYNCAKYETNLDSIKFL